MEQLLSMGFSQELATQALAATGGNSTLKATEWLLSHRREAETAAAVTEASSRGAYSPAKQQARVDRFFSSPSRPHPSQARQTDDTPASRNDEDSKICSLDARKSPSHGRDAPSPARALAPFAIPSASPLELPLKRKGAEGDPDCYPRSGTSVIPHLPAAPKMPPLQPQHTSSKSPLAERMRPISVGEIVGQDHLLGPGCILRSLVESDTMVSVIFWGPPGTGKTSLARAIARAVSCRFVTASAVTSGVKEVRGILEEAKRLKKSGQRTLFFMDEVHRFNKAQQDAFLPYIEAGHVIFIGATTENPSFEVNGALLSRCKVLILNKLQPVNIKELLGRALSAADRGVMVPLADDSLVQRIEAEEEALYFLAEAADGDARVALNALEIAVACAVSRERHRFKSFEKDSFQTLLALDMNNENKKENVVSSTKGRASSVDAVNLKRELPLKQYTRPFKRFVGGREVTPIEAHDVPVVQQGETTKIQVECNSLVDASVASSIINVRLADISEALQRSHLLYDKKGEEHYNIISALHKSMRGGDADAALYWLARMMEGGEGPLYIARRLVRFASEDVGLADPQAIMLAVACYQACHFIGMPECNVHLAQCVAYLSVAPKSIAVYQAIETAQQLVKKSGNEPVPLHLRNAPTGLMKELGYGKGYIYPPNHAGPIEQEYLPSSLQGYKFLKWP